MVAVLASIASPILPDQIFDTFNQREFDEARRAEIKSICGYDDPPLQTKRFSWIAVTKLEIFSIQLNRLVNQKIIQNNLPSVLTD